MTVDDQRPFYGLARIICGIGLFALIAVLFLLDVASPEFTFDSLQLGLLLGTALLLLGVEAGKYLIGRS